MPAPGEIYQVAQKFQLPTNDVLFNVYDFLVLSGSSSDAAMLTMFTNLMQNLYAWMSTDIHSTVNGQEGIVNQLLWDGAKWLVSRYVGQILPSMTFTGSLDALPSATSALVTFPTYVPRVVGKKYLPPFTEAAQASSVLIGSALANMANYGGALITPVSDAGGTQYQYVVRRKTGATATPYAAVAESIISSQRRRKPGLGI